MHTFFVNTSKRSLNYYEVLFDICHENMELVSYDYSMADWFSEDKGYIACADKMAKDIDNNAEITNDFNLVVYIDLCEIRQYTAIAPEEARSKAVFLRALRMLYLHFINETLVSALEKEGRYPANTLIMLGEDVELDDHFEKDNRDRFRDDITAAMMGFFGFPTDEAVITEIARRACESEAGDQVAVFRDALDNLAIETRLPGAREVYQAFADRWYQDIIALKDVKYAFNGLSRSIEQKYNSENIYSKVHWVSCRCDSYAFGRNKSAHAVVQLSIACYLAECVYSGTVLDGSGQPRQFVLCDAAKSAGILNMRKQTYASKMTELIRLTRTYSDLKLAPKLHAFDHNRFQLDEQGNSASSFAPVPEKTDRKVGEQQPAARKEEKPNWLLSKDEYTPFPYYGEEFSSGVNPGGKDPAKYRSAAQKLREHHAVYLTKLREHAKGVLANYASDSTGNHQAVLRKRAVSIADSDYADPANDYKYAPAGKPVETKKVEVAEDNSKRAYDSAVMRYLEFCAARSVAVTDIEELFEWINRRIDQIEESLKRLKQAGIGALIALFVLYIPYAVVQWEAITKNAVTLLYAIASMAVPVGVLAVVYLILAAYQKDKFYRVWKIFKEKSDLVLQENAEAALKYDRLLAEIIPSLRWIYEYKLDVDFYTDCCRLAKAKAEHHAGKLRERVNAIGNIIEDLEVASIPQYVFQEKVGEGVDLNVSYCTGEKNIRYYSILNEELLRILRNGEEG